MYGCLRLWLKKRMCYAILSFTVYNSKLHGHQCIRLSLVNMKYKWHIRIRIKVKMVRLENEYRRANWNKKNEWNTCIILYRNILYLQYTNGIWSIYFIHLFYFVVFFLLVYYCSSALVSFSRAFFLFLPLCPCVCSVFIFC